MSKAVLATWPFLMLLLDYWPLGRVPNAECRMQNANARDTHHPSSVAALRRVDAPRNTQHATRNTLVRLVWEKIPFLGLSVVSCVLTWLTESGRQEAHGLLVQSSALLRLENAFAAYIRYLGKTFWPTQLALPYANPGHWSWLEVTGSVLLVVGVCLVVLWLGRRCPYLLVGWCWFLGTLVPVIGLTRGWDVFIADRFTYVPSIGVLILAVWGVCELTRGRRRRGRR